MMKTIFRILLLFVFLVIALASFLFIKNNSQLVGMWLFVELSPRPAGFWYLLCFVAGGVTGLGAGLGIYRHIRNRLKIHKLEARLTVLSDENRKLKQAIQPTSLQEQ